MDFYTTDVVMDKKKEKIIIRPSFQYTDGDLICKGGMFNAFWDGEKWASSINYLQSLIDRDTMEESKHQRELHPDYDVSMHLMKRHNTKLRQEVTNYFKLAETSQPTFNQKIIFDNYTPVREDYSTISLDYHPTDGDTPAFDELMGVLYADRELEKILWFMGALLANEAHRIQKFLFLYGAKGTGKGTVLKIFEMLFQRYIEAIDLQRLTGGSEFATSEIKEVPIMIDYDCDISKIKDDTNLLKMTAHETIRINGKYAVPYDVIFQGLLVTASNERFKVKHVDSGITRRAVVAEPSQNLVSGERYLQLMEQIKFEIPALAYKAIQHYRARGPMYYESYVAIENIEETDYMFAFVKEYRAELGDPVTLTSASALYKEYLTDLGFTTDGYKAKLKKALKRYYTEYYPEKQINGVKFKNVYLGFKNSLFINAMEVMDDEKRKIETWIELKRGASIFDETYREQDAQLANAKGTPSVKWKECETKLKDLDTSQLHFVRVPSNHIVIDFDCRGEDGNKSLEESIKAASAFPITYAEISKSGQGLHLHYIYDGDVSKLSSVYDDNIEIKTSKGKSSIRRMLSECTSNQIATIATGLPLKEENRNMYNDVKEMVWTEQKIRTAIKRNLRKEYHANTRPSMDFIYKILEDACAANVYYDVEDMYQDVFNFALKSSNQSTYCLGLIAKMKFENQPEVPKESTGGVVPNSDLWMYDVEVYPNLFVIVAKQYGTKNYIKLINPDRYQVEEVLQLALVGFFNLKYDNHIMYGGLMGETNEELFKRSQLLIDNDRAGSNSNAYQLSYLDIYEMATTKQSLKKWEVELGIKHDEMDWPWDKPIPEELWPRVVEYCTNDVDATEAVFDACEQDYNARCILADLSGLSINHKTQDHTAQIIFEGDKNAKDKFVYTDLSEEFPGYTYSYKETEIHQRNGNIRKVKKMVSEYMGDDPSEGGYVYSEPGVYEDVALLDIASQHPHSLIAMNYFGPYTKNYADLVDARLAIKHQDFSLLATLYNGKLMKYVDPNNPVSLKKLSYGLKIPINIVYGMTSASFPNPFKHPKNVDNIVAKRGALFMIKLRHELQDRGVQVCHIKTDSIKLPGASKETIDFVMEFGRKYQYEFEHEHTYKVMALANKADYIAKLEDDTWEATGARFAQPYVYKKLFSKEELTETDFFITKSATTPIYLGENFVGKVAQVYASKTGERLMRVSGPDTKAAVTGTSDFNFQLASDFKGHKDIDMSYYDQLCIDAITTINKVGPTFKVITDCPKEYEEHMVPF